MSYHLNPKTGEPGPCKASKKCPFGDPIKDHYDTPGQAREAFEFKNDAFNDSKVLKLGKRLAFILRHHPEMFDVTLNPNGFASLEVIEKVLPCTPAQLLAIVKNDSKGRYEIVGKEIRAVQGHSTKVDLELIASEPPKTLFHGTSKKNLDSILTGGVKPMSRHHVHLSQTKATAIEVGSRHGEVVILEVNSKAMHEAGVSFYKTINSVWLVDEVPTNCIKVVE